MLTIIYALFGLIALTVIVTIIRFFYISKSTKLNMSDNEKFVEKVTTVAIGTIIIGILNIVIQIVNFVTPI